LDEEELKENFYKLDSLKLDEENKAQQSKYS
jgi:hypothetical protein